MFLHRKELIQPVKVGKPDARFGTFLLEQFGGATGELTAALQYWVQSFHIENAGIRDMLQDIALEEFGHLEMVGKLIAQHTSKVDQTAVYDAPLFKLKPIKAICRELRVRGRSCERFCGRRRRNFITNAVSSRCRGLGRGRTRWISCWRRMRPSLAANG